MEEVGMTARNFAVALVLSACAVSPALAQAPVAAGRVKIASGNAFIIRQNVEIPATVGMPVFQSDSLRTGDGRIGVTMKDDTRVSIGPRSEVRLDRFAYAPADGQVGFAMRVVRGVAAYVSGHIAKLAPDAVRLETPAAIVGVRGTSLAISAGVE
jgi:hypothetical protein